MEKPVACEYFDVDTGASIGEPVMRLESELPLINRNLDGTGTQVRVKALEPKDESAESSEPAAAEKPTKGSRKRKAEPAPASEPATVAAPPPPMPDMGHAMCGADQFADIAKTDSGKTINTKGTIKKPHRLTDDERIVAVGIDYNVGNGGVDSIVAYHVVALSSYSGRVWRNDNERPEDVLAGWFEGRAVKHGKTEYVLTQPVRIRQSAPPVEPAAAEPESTTALPDDVGSLLDSLDQFDAAETTPTDAELESGDDDWLGPDLPDEPKPRERKSVIWQSVVFTSPTEFMGDPGYVVMGAERYIPVAAFDSMGEQLSLVKELKWDVQDTACDPPKLKLNPSLPVPADGEQMTIIRVTAPVGWLDHVRVVYTKDDVPQRVYKLDGEPIMNESGDAFEIPELLDWEIMIDDATITALYRP